MHRCPTCGEALIPGLGARPLSRGGLALTIANVPILRCVNGHAPVAIPGELEDLAEKLAARLELLAGPGRSLSLAATFGPNPPPLEIPVEEEPEAPTVEPVCCTLPPPEFSNEEMVLAPSLRAVMDKILAAVANPERLAALLGPRLGPRSRRKLVILTGPPGVGKSELARIIAARAGRPLLTPKPSRVKGELVGQTEKAVERVFAEARAAGAFLFFDEGETFAGTRVHARAGHEISMVNQVLGELDQHDGVVILATNAGDSLDAAVRNRATVVHVSPPTAGERRAILSLLLRESGLFPAPNEEDLRALDSRVEDHERRFPSAPPVTGRDLRLVIEDAAARANLRASVTGLATPFGRLDVERALVAHLETHLTQEQREQPGANWAARLRQRRAEAVQVAIEVVRAMATEAGEHERHAEVGEGVARGRGQQGEAAATAHATGATAARSTLVHAEALLRLPRLLADEADPQALADELRRLRAAQLRPRPEA
jgi:hypothetical protein